MMSKNYDGLQNDLDKMDGVFLKRGQYTDPLDRERLWDFTPLAKVGDTVQGSDWLGEVPENSEILKIMVPFQLEGKATIKSIAPAGQYKIEDTIATLIKEDGRKSMST
jgi:V/A-type H+-transporting ATPase subunit A